MEISDEQLPKSKFSTVYSMVKSWQFLYLVMFAIGVIIPLAWTQFENYSYLWISLVFLVFSFLIKLILLICKDKSSLRDFVKIQWSFIVPYVMLVINLVLGFLPDQVQAQKVLFSQKALGYELDWDLMNTMSNIRFMLSTMICSLIMTQKVRKFQFYGIFCLILLFTGAQLNQNIVLIKNINEFSDHLSDEQTNYLMLFIDGKLSAEQYLHIYQQGSFYQSIIENTKDYGLASIASIIAQFLSMLDVIARPRQKEQQKQEIYQGLVTNFGLSKKTKRQVQITTLNHKSTHKHQSN